jgi:hypothetical protein
MRHAFSFPVHIREVVRAHIQKAVASIDPARFRQEPAYTAALLARLEGTAYEESDGSVILRTTNVDSIAPGAAESWAGADLAITADIRKGENAVTKAILAQAKRGALEDLSRRDRDDLLGQIRQMRQFTRWPKVFLFREIDGRRMPEVASGSLILKGLNTHPEALPDYFVRRILTTFDGDTRPAFVASVQESSLKHLRVLARLESSSR